MTFGEIRFFLSKLAPGVDPDLLDGWINNRYQSILDRHAWKDLEKDGTIVTVAAYQTGTVSVTLGSAAVVGTGTTFTAGMTGSKFKVTYRNESYIFTQTGATTGTLDRVYEGATDATAPFAVYQDVALLPADYKLPVIQKNERIPGEIVHWTRPQLERAAPSRVTIGEPAIYVLAPDTAAGLHQAQLYPAPQFAASYPLVYIFAVARFGDADTGLSILPFVSIQALLESVQIDIATKAGAVTTADRFARSSEALILKMLVRDAQLRGQGQLRMAPQYTRHRLDRAMKGRGRDRRVLP